jgi:hypothetical protein
MKMNNKEFDPTSKGKNEKASERNNAQDRVVPNSVGGNDEAEMEDVEEVEEEIDVDSFDKTQDDDNYDVYDEYGNSGEKYGWYNGWSDDAIDDAFEGDPENTWNVD